MKTVKNISTERQAITGIPMFEAGEERIVCDETAQILLGNDNFSLLEKNSVSNETSSQKKAKSK